MKACGGGYSPETRRKYYITGPQWAAAYQGQALVSRADARAGRLRRCDREYAAIGIGYWCTHDTDVIPTEALGKDGQAKIVEQIKKIVAQNMAWSAPW
jgi:xylose isomerase